MSYQPLDASDPRWQLIERVLTSVLFEKSPRLCSFLHFVCELELTGRGEEINEQQVGIHVFGRPANYNPGEDGIVRSQARFLRQRLAEYFKTLGSHEPLTITIPKGSYVPVFEPNAAAVSPSEVVTVVEHVASVALPPKNSVRFRINLAISLVILLAVTAIGILFAGKRGSPPSASPDGRFWSEVFQPGRPAVIVPADGTLILIEELTNQPVHLQDYLSRDYTAKMSSSTCCKSMASPNLGSRRYTSMADLKLVSGLMRIPASNQGNVEVRYARDLSISEAKETNLILIGGARANPWVELFADKMNFYVDYVWKTGSNSVVNKMPHSGEAPLYTEKAENGSQRVYGLIAFLPSLDHKSNALLVAGTSAAGTESAADFVLNEPALGSFLHGFERRDGSIPHFEILLEASSVGGNTPQSTILAYHILP